MSGAAVAARMSETFGGIDCVLVAVKAIMQPGEHIDTISTNGSTAASSRPTATWHLQQERDQLDMDTLACLAASRHIGDSMRA